MNRFDQHQKRADVCLTGRRKALSNRRKRSAQAGTAEGMKDGGPQGRDTAGRGSSVQDSLPAHSGSPTEVSQSDLAARLSSATVVGRTQRAKQMPSYKAAKSPRPLKSSDIHSAGLLLRTKLIPRNGATNTSDQRSPVRLQKCVFVGLHR